MNQSDSAKNTDARERHAGLFDISRNPPSHPQRSLLNHSYGYASVHDHPACTNNIDQKFQILVRNVG